MLRTTAIQIVAALIFIAVMFGIHQAAAWSTTLMSPDFLSGTLFGAILMAVFGLVAYRLEKSAAFGRGQKQRPSDTIDL